MKLILLLLGLIIFFYCAACYVRYGFRYRKVATFTYKLREIIKNCVNDDLAQGYRGFWRYRMLDELAMSKAALSYKGKVLRRLDPRIFADIDLMDVLVLHKDICFLDITVKRNKILHRPKQSDINSIYFDNHNRFLGDLESE